MHMQLRQRRYLGDKRHATGLGNIHMILVSRFLLRQYAQHKTAVVSQSGTVLGSPLCIESYFHLCHKINSPAKLSKKNETTAYYGQKKSRPPPLLHMF